MTEVPRPIATETASRERRPWFRNWRVWLGIAITAVCIWFSTRGIPLGDVRRAMASGDMLFVWAVSIPSYVMAVFARSLRWRHLTNPIASIPRSMMFRAQAIGFMVNNIIPLRIGELVRSWYLARESGTSATAILGTVVLERVLDVVCVLLMAAGALTLLDPNSGDTGMFSRGALWLLPAAAFPLLLLTLLRVAPQQVLALARFASRPFPQHVDELLERALSRFTMGLGALSGGSHLFWIVVHSITIWLVFSTLPFWAALHAFDLDLGPPLQMLTTSWILLAAVGVAVAIPSAPGFVGPYHWAFKEVLVRLGVEPATALAVALVTWFVFWLILTLQGLLLLRMGGVSLGELTQESSKDPSPDRR